MFISTADPIIFSLGSFSLRWYGVLFSGGFILGYFIMQYMFRRKHYNSVDLDILLVLIFVGVVLGARLLHCLVYEPDYYLAAPLEILKIWKGGLASHGGTLGVFLALYLFNRKRHYSYLELLDMLCVPTALVGCLIRIGNFMNSEILGIPTQSDYGVVFAALGESFPRHPAQLYEAAAYFIIFILVALWYFLTTKRPQGAVFGLMFSLVFSARFVIEPFKVEQADYSTGTIFSVGQYLSIPFILAGLAVIAYSYLKKPTKSQES